MRNRIKTAQTRLAVGRNGFRISVSAICLLSALSPAASQTLGTQGASGSPYQLRGTTGSSVTGEASAASTLYGALPAARPGVAFHHPASAMRQAQEQPARAHLRKI
jgi:hypothetical protein